MSKSPSSPDEDPTTLRFASQLLPSPPNAPPATPSALDLESAVALYSHAVLLFHAYSWHQSIKYHRSILRRDVGGLLPAAHLWFNIGIIRCHLGEYALAVEALDKATEHDPDLSIAWFCMGIALFQLGDYRRAERRFKRCLTCLGPDDDDDVVPLIDYKPQGLRFSLEITRVEFNVRLCLLWKLHKQVKAEKPPPWSLNRMPAGLLIEPPEEKQESKENSPTEATKTQQGDELRLPLLPKKSRLLKNAPKRVLTVLRRRPRRDNSADTGRVREKSRPNPAVSEATSPGWEVKPSSSPALYIPTFKGPYLPLQSTSRWDHRTDSFAIIAPESGDGPFKPLPPLPPPPIRSDSPPARASFIDARRQSALAWLTGERSYSSSAPPVLLGGAAPSRMRPSPLNEEYRADVRDSLAIFAMGVLRESEERDFGCWE